MARSGDGQLSVFTDTCSLKGRDSRKLLTVRGEADPASSPGLARGLPRRC